MPLGDFSVVHLMFADGLDEIEAVVCPPLSRWPNSKRPQAVSGTVRGPENLEQFLRELGADGYIVTSGDPLRQGVTHTIHRVSPDQIVAALKTRFASLRDFLDRAPDRKSVDNSEGDLGFPVDLLACATNTGRTEGLRRAQIWFQHHP